MRPLIPALCFMVLGSFVGAFVDAQGFGALPAFLLSVAGGPAVIGLILRRNAVAAALAFNVAVVIAMHVSNLVWLSKHGFDVAAKFTEGLPFSAFMLVIACCGAATAHVSNRMRFRGELQERQ